jgi:hypothetical protein
MAYFRIFYFVVEREILFVEALSRQYIRKEVVENVKGMRNAQCVYGAFGYHHLDFGGIGVLSYV